MRHKLSGGVSEPGLGGVVTGLSTSKGKSCTKIGKHVLPSDFRFLSRQKYSCFIANFIDVKMESFLKIILKCMAQA